MWHGRLTQEMDVRRGFYVAWGGAAILALLACFFLVLATSVVAHAAADAPVLKPGDHEIALTVDGRERTYLLHVPAKYKASAKTLLPLVMMLHGAGGGGAQSEKQTGWDKKADSETFAAVFPDALPASPHARTSFLANPRFWNDHSGRGNAEHENIDDVAFLSAVFDDVEKRLPIDTKREYLTGFSSGASMTFLAAIKMSERIAAAAPVSGHYWGHDANVDRAVPLLLIFGNKDPLNPWDGGTVKMVWGNSDQKPPVMDTVRAWARFTGCPPEPAPLSDKGGVKRVAYGPGHNGAEFLFVTIDGAGHTWPGGKEALPESVVGSSTDKLNATDIIWMFFSRHFLAPRQPVGP